MTAVRTKSIGMAMLPNDHHPGPRCSCAECLRQYPDVPQPGHAKRGAISFLPGHTGDGYNYGGGIVVTFGNRSLIVAGIDAMKGYLPEDLAFARLLVAAPDLLEMLQRCKNWLSVHPDGRDMQLAIQAKLKELELVTDEVTP